MFGNVIIREKEAERKGDGFRTKKGGNTLFLPAYIFKGEKYQWKTGKKGGKARLWHSLQWWRVHRNATRGPPSPSIS